MVTMMIEGRTATVVHNHGPEEGRGLYCPEYRGPDGKLEGECIQMDRAWSEYHDRRLVPSAIKPTLWPPPGTLA